MKKKLLALFLGLALILGMASVAGAATHSVVEGDNLSKLAEQYLGDSTRWKEIYEANKSIISNPNVIYVGQELVIPDVDEPSAPVAPNVPDAPSVEYNDVPFKLVNLPESDPNYYAELWAAEVYNYKLIRNLFTLFESKGFDSFCGNGSVLLKYDVNALTDAQKEKILETKAAREALIQLRPYEGLDGVVLYIWGEDMPVLTENVQDKFTIDSYDNSDFRPYLVPYLMDDPSQAKGNLILISGGGNFMRGTEAEDVSPLFVELGYNCFVLQRRVQPYSSDEIAMDLQRAIRCIKYYGEEWGLGGLDVIGAAGFSGGGGNTRTVIEKYYGYITPDQFDPDYVCDEIDAMNSDMQIAMPIYSGGVLNTENPNIPHLYIAVGGDDAGIAASSIEMYQQAYEMGLEPEFHIFGKVGHGFGPGIEGSSSTTWVQSADLYIQHILGLNKPEYDGVPADYTLTQSVVITWLPVGDIETNIYTTADYSKFYINFQAWNDDIIIECILVGDNVAGVIYDSSGHFSNDVQKMWDLVDPAAWEPYVK